MRKLVISIAIALVLVAGLSWFLLSQSRPLDPSLSQTTAGARPAPGRVERSSTRGDGGAVKASVALPAPPPGTPPLLSGKVLDEAEQPIPGALVSVRATLEGSEGLESSILARAMGRSSSSSRSEALAEAVTDPDGLYQIAFAVPPEMGEYEVEARAGGFVPREETWWNQGAAATLDFHLEAAGESIEGMVADMAGAPIQGAKVEAGRDEEGRSPGDFFRGRLDRQRAMASDITGETGRFRLAVPSGRYRVSARAEGFVPASERGVEAGTEDLFVYLAPARNLTGRVVDEGGKPLAAAMVLIYPDEEGRFQGPQRGPSRVRRLFQDPAGRAETEADGSFRLTDLSLRGFMLEVSKSGFARGQKEGTLPPEGEAPPVEVQLHPGGIISGTVLDGAGTPLPRLTVALRDEAGGDRDRNGRRGRDRGPGGRRFEGRAPEGEAAAETPERGPGGRGAGERGPGERGFLDRLTGRESAGPDTVSLFRADAVAETDGEGKFIFDTIERSVFTLSVQSNRHVPFQREGIEAREEHVTVEVMLDSGIELGGQVTDQSKEPVPGANLQARVGETDRRTARADSEGRFSFQGLSPGRLREVRVRAPGFTTLYGEDIEVLPSPRKQEQYFIMDRSASLAGRVVGADGEPVAGARLRVASVEGEDPVSEGDEGGESRWNLMRRRRETERSTTSDAGGAFLVKDVNSGPAFRMIVTHADHQELRSDPFPVQPGAQIEGLLYRLRAGGRVVVRVSRPDQSPAAGVRVELQRRRDEEGEGGGDRGRGRRDLQRRNDQASRVTGADGKAVLSGLTGGLYTLSVVESGFQPFRQRELGVVEDRTLEMAVELLPENVITGVIADTSGAPITGARVNATNRGEFGRATTQADGTFRVGSLGPGPYQVRLTAEGFADRVLEEVQVNTPLELSLERRGAIQGVVMAAETGEPIQSFRVVLQREGRIVGMESEADPAAAGAGDGAGGGPGASPGGFGGRGAFFRGRSRSPSRDFQDPGGNFLLSEIDPGSYHLRVSARGFSPREAPVRVAEGATAGIRVLLYEGIVVTGLVVDQATTQPLGGAEILVYTAPEEAAPGGTEVRRERVSGAASQRRERTERPSGQGAAATRRLGRPLGQPTASDEAGGFAVRDLPPGKYVLVANHPDFVIGQEPFEIRSEGLTRELRVALAPGEELSGTITEAGGIASAGVQVSLRDSSGLRKQGTTSASGEYFIRGLIPGTHTLMVGSQGRTDRKSVEIKKGENSFNLQRSAPAE